MTQKYTKVTWQDETTSQQGTLINAERLDQMQTAHHYADGFEEVDAVPTEDPDVDYHKVVFCTADTTFYRWDGTQWVKDVDDSTLALLEAHEADHSNPHVVTKAQVGLGNVDNTSDEDKPVSTAMQTALDDKVTIIPVTSGVKFYSQSSGGTSLYQGTSSPVTGITSVPMRDSSGRIKTAAPSANDDTANKKYVDDADALKINTAALVSAWQVTPDDAHIPSEKLVKTYIDTSLTDGSVTKVGTATVGGNLKPVYLNAGVPTAVANDLVDVSSTQRVQGEKNYDTNKLGEKDNGVAVFSTVPASHRQNILLRAIDVNNDWFAREEHWAYNGGSSVYNRAVRKQISGTTYTNEFKQNIAADGTTYMTGPSRTYNASNTSDIVNIGLLDAYTPMVRTTGNQTIAGNKTFSNTMRIDGAREVILNATNAAQGLVLESTTDDRGTTPVSDNTYPTIRFSDKNDTYAAQIELVHKSTGGFLFQVRMRDSLGNDQYITLAETS